MPAIGPSDFGLQPEGMCELLRLLVDPLGVGTLNDAGFGGKGWAFFLEIKGPQKRTFKKLASGSM